jgi:hypothetical protein
MTDTRPYGSWLRALSGLLAAAAVLTLTACGGGSGAPNNPYVDGVLTKALTLLPTGTAAAPVNLYADVPTVLTISGGKPPYSAASTNSAIVPTAATVSGSTIVLVANSVSADTPVTITVRDANGSVATSALVVHPSTLISGVTVTPNLADCGSNAVCSGQNAVASVQVQNPTGGPLAGRAIRFDVVAGPFGIVSTAPGSPVVSSFTTTSDALGKASVIIKANVNAPTQQAQLRATDLTGGQQVTANFLIQQVTDGAKILSVVPPTVTITGPDKNSCSSGARVDYLIYGGTPPYRITPTFPNASSLVNSTVNASGGFFEVVTNGTCSAGDGLLYSIVDATGLQITAHLVNSLGTGDPVTTPEQLVAKPPAPNPLPATCSNSSATFVITGGVPKYSVVLTSLASTMTGIPTITPQTGIGLNDPVTVSGLTGSGVTTLTVTDLGGHSATVTITCP